jgi:hypothetical protein
LISALCLFASALLATSASATETYSADYYDDGEYLHLIEGWEDPYAVPDPEADFYTQVTMPLHGGGGVCCGSGQVNGMEPIPDGDDASETAHVSESSARDLEKAPESTATTSSTLLPRRRFNEVVSTGRRIFASGIIRVVFQQDNGDGFSMFARRARWEPGENYDVTNSEQNCDTDGASRGISARGLAIANNPSVQANANGVTYTLTHGNGTDVFRNITHATNPCMVSTTCDRGDNPGTMPCPL